MNQSIDPQEIACRFNKDEMIWRRYCQKRGLRRLRHSPSPFPCEMLDRLDWLDAERECRETRCVGKLFQ